ncbi:MAG: hypothetical protein GY807_22055 [Gammaproteobacteria bacterium]|nr:hypothetical protein [Gammaproteobacteria bacterium]
MTEAIWPPLTRSDQQPADGGRQRRDVCTDAPHSHGTRRIGCHGKHHANDTVDGLRTQGERI